MPKPKPRVTGTRPWNLLHRDILGVLATRLLLCLPLIRGNRYSIQSRAHAGISLSDAYRSPAEWARRLGKWKPLSHELSPR